MIQINPVLVPRWYLMSFGRGREEIWLYCNRMSDSQTPTKQSKGSVWERRRKSLGVFQKALGKLNNPSDTPHAVWHSVMSQKPLVQVRTKHRQNRWPGNVAIDEWINNHKCPNASLYYSLSGTTNSALGSTWVRSLRLMDNEDLACQWSHSRWQGC